MRLRAVASSVTDHSGTLAIGAEKAEADIGRDASGSPRVAEDRPAACGRQCPPRISAGCRAAPAPVNVSRKTDLPFRDRRCATSTPSPSC
ncbi:hypothetical protein Maq22A_c19885 [Methylobacterium aquaticum]|uniref:Uncharacterized protein n=1 Tax=Methylobacterium aquaticum TaxID=270351 RepID=A0A0C6FIY4_9HYPH|nr:hypothetical protein Maq22A_c19885 [Methylobacterium aquaticum]